MPRNIPVFQRLTKKTLKKDQKKVVQKLEFAKKCVILHPFSREKRGKALTE